MAQLKLGVILIGMGGPDTLDDVEPYLRNVRRGRPFTKDFLDGLIDKYRKIGGGSPLLSGSREQAEALEAALKKKGLDAKVTVGMRHWPPYVEDGLKELLTWGADRVVGLCLTPQESHWSSEGYHEALEAAARDLKPDLEPSFISGWHLEQGFLEALGERVEKASEGLTRPLVVFTAHSLPLRAVEGDHYVEQLNETAQAISQLLSIAPTRLAYQSQSPSGEPWLGPDVGTVLEELNARNVGSVVLAPIGFITEHLETLFDLDVLYAEKAAMFGMKYARARTVGTHPALIRCWTELIDASLHPDRVPGRIN